MLAVDVGFCYLGVFLLFGTRKGTLPYSTSRVQCQCLAGYTIPPYTLQVCTGPTPRRYSPVARVVDSMSRGGRVGRCKWSVAATNPKNCPQLRGTILADLSAVPHRPAPSPSSPHLLQPSICHATMYFALKAALLPSLSRLCDLVLLPHTPSEAFQRVS